jgi:hypothetical protein
MRVWCTIIVLGASVMFQVQQSSNTPSHAADISGIDVYIIGGVGG